jgi:hypothetical protein
MSTHVDKSQLRAIPTEYRGVTYRSKSEAMFAVFLSYYLEARLRDRRYIAAGLEYEPAWSKVGDYVFDFCFHIVRPSESGVVYSRALIEYKPKFTTASYQNRFVNRCKKAEKALSSQPCEIQFYLAEIDFWNCESRKLKCNKDTWQLEVFFERNFLTPEHCEFIRSTRFDLVGGSR